jgi:hypothetical protein
MIIPSVLRGSQSRLSHGKRRLSTVQFRESGRMDTIASMRVCRHCEERSDEAIHCHLVLGYGLLRFARNDSLKTILAV